MVKLKRNRPSGGPSNVVAGKKRGGGAGRGNNDPNQMLAQMQKIQEQMEQTQAELDNEEVTASVGGGMVTVVATANQEIRAVTIQPEVLDPDDIDLLISVLNKNIQEHPEEAHYYFNRAVFRGRIEDYNGAIEDLELTHDQAVDFADQMVSQSQGSGGAMDLSAIQAGADG